MDWREANAALDHGMGADGLSTEAEGPRKGARRKALRPWQRTGGTRDGGCQTERDCGKERKGRPVGG